MPCDNPEISVGMYWLVHNIDSALMALIKMASIKRDSWELLLRKQISEGFGRIRTFGLNKILSIIPLT